MTTLALCFMVGSWSFVLGLTGWCYVRVLRSRATEGRPEGSERPGDT